MRKFFDGGEAGSANATTPASNGTQAAATPLQLTAEQARAKGRELVAAADRETDTFERRRLNDEAQRYFAMASKPEAKADAKAQGPRSPLDPNGSIRPQQQTLASSLQPQAPNTPAEAARVL